MSNYIVDFASGGSEGVPRKESIVLPEKIKNSTSTSVVLTGRGVNNWGEIQQENFIRLMENFASNTPPENPTIGQLWYNSAESILYIHVDELQVTYMPLYYPQSPARWAQVWPAVTAFAGISEYNNLALEFNRIIGTPSVLGSDSDNANNQYGWGQTDLVPVYNSENQLNAQFDSTVYPPVFDNKITHALLSRLRKALRHVGQPETLGSSIGFVNDSRPKAPGNTLANSFNDYPTNGTLENIKAGYNGLGTVALINKFNDTVNAISTLQTNRFNIAALSSQLNVLTSLTRSTAWVAPTITHSMELTFASENAAKAYFNSGGSLKFDWSHSGPADTLNDGWTNFLATETGLSLDFTGMKRGTTYVNVSSSNPVTVGFYDLTSSFQDLFSKDRTYSAYENGSGGNIRIEARIVSGATFKIEINVHFSETPVPGETLTGTTISSLTGKKASVANTNQPGIAQPVTVSSGNFA